MSQEKITIKYNRPIRCSACNGEGGEGVNIPDAGEGGACRGCSFGHYGCVLLPDPLQLLGVLDQGKVQQLRLGIGADEVRRHLAPLPVRDAADRMGVHYIDAYDMGDIVERMAGLIDDIPAVEEVIGRMIREAEEIVHGRLVKLAGR